MLNARFLRRAAPLAALVAPLLLSGCYIVPVAPVPVYGPVYKPYPRPHYRGYYRGEYGAAPTPVQPVADASVHIDVASISR